MLTLIVKNLLYLTKFIILPQDDSVKDELEEEFSVSQGEEEDPVVEPPRKRLLLDHDEGSNSSQDIQSSLSVRRSARQPVGEAPKEDEKGVLRECLFYIQKNLQR